MDRWIIPVLGEVPIKEIGRKHLTDVLDALPQTSPALPRSVFALMRKTFAWAVERGDLERNPVEGMKSPKPVKARERTLNSSELRSVLLAAGGLNEPFASLVRVLAISGQRLGEVSGMAWSELDQTQRIWTIPGSRTKNSVTHSVPINDVFARELADLAGTGPWPKSGLVFTTNGTSPVSDFSGMKRRLDAIALRQNGSSIPPWRLHDLRRSFVTNLQKLDVRWEVIEALLNHVGTAKGGVAGVSQRHDWFEEKIFAMRLWDEALRKIVIGEVNG